uniref:ATP synthase complex subunit 8 n=1 Tax=Doederleinia berycoides TaxID=223795 RepID=A4QJ87_DOEBE|nr:ATP synthase F0 subunit 8 [Doederleinia berycoides]BAF51950.1 ATPase subunit 8 [Doederleinia berycoides]
MPQLNPVPWFAILMFSWLIFLTVVPPKVLGHVSLNDFVLQSIKAFKTASWNWPWY